MKSILNLEELEELLFKLDSFKRNNEKKLEIADNKRFVFNSIHLTIIFRCITLKFSFYIYQYNVSFCHLILFTLYQYKLLCIYNVSQNNFKNICLTNNIFPHFFHSPIFFSITLHIYILHVTRRATILKSCLLIALPEELTPCHRSRGITSAQHRTLQIQSFHLPIAFVR